MFFIVEHFVFAISLMILNLKYLEHANRSFVNMITDEWAVKKKLKLEIPIFVFTKMPKFSSYVLKNWPSVQNLSVNY